MPSPVGCGSASPLTPAAAGLPDGRLAEAFQVVVVLRCSFLLPWRGWAAVGAA